ncbi:TerB N-terminal domain-containing protein [Anaerotignum sp.]|uniref:TerB N-terminal domain-containing protein n=1 Tax=Anaerotignum sp. TaxID=2039241 RepID=UPI003AB620B7
MEETSFSYVFLYIYELINHIGIQNSLDGLELPQVVRTAQKSLYVGKYKVLSGVAQRKRRHSSF